MKVPQRKQTSHQSVWRERVNNSITRIWGVERAGSPGESREAGHQVDPKPARGTELMGGEGSMPPTDGALPQDTCSPEGRPYVP